jgi:hypothetical protein
MIAWRHKRLRCDVAQYGVTMGDRPYSRFFVWP